MGNVEGLFIAEENEIQQTMGKTIDFGEALGKHSEINGRLESRDVEVKSDDQDFLVKLENTIGNSTISGYNPLHYICH